MVNLLRLALAALGVSAVLIAASILLLGAQATAGMAEGAFSAMTGLGGHVPEPWPPTMDSELRFYAALWGAYGIVLLWVASNLGRRIDLVPWLAAVFFAGGLGRGLSLAFVGRPHPFFLFLMAIELGLPPLLLVLWLAARRPAR
jgi:hypothetical protein